MAVQAKDGTRHHSASRASLHDELSAKAGKPAPKVEPDAKDTRGAEHVAGDTDVSGMDIGDVVSEHGPAHHIVVHHDHENKVHTVTSHHGKPAHMHHSEHGSAEEAHDHARKAAGVEPAETEDGEPLEEAMETPETEEAEQSRAGAIPGMG
jgi:hypothetical protein